MAVANPNITAIIIDDTEYSLLEVPAAESPLVIDAKKKILGVMDLESLVRDMDRLGGFILLSYNAINAAGPDYTDENIKIQRMGFKITYLCDDAALVIHDFQNTSSNIIEDTRSSYEFLLESLEGMALETLAAIAKHAGKMEAAARNLSEKFTQERDKAQSILEDVTIAEGKAEARKQKAEEEQKTEHIEKEKTEKDLEEAKKLEEEAKKSRCEYEEKENAQIADIGNPQKRLVNSVAKVAVASFSFTGDISDPEARKQKAKEEQKTEHIEKEKNEKSLEEPKKLEEEAKKSRREYEEKENAQIADNGHNTVKQVANRLKEFAITHIGNSVKGLFNSVVKVVTAGLAGDIFDPEAPKIQAAAWKEKREQELAEEKKQREKRQKLMDRQAEFAKEVINRKIERNTATIAKQALHHAVEALKNLAEIMQQAALFWNQLQKHCGELADSQLQPIIEKAMKLSAKKRLKVWTSSSFKRKAINFYAGWVALNSVCNGYMDSIKVTRVKLHGYIRQNPTQEQSLEDIDKIARDVISGIEKDRKAPMDGSNGN